MPPPTPPSAGVPGTSQRPALLAHFVWAFVGVGLMLGAWSLATPLGAAPDEPEHTAQAAAIVRGQIDEPDHPFPGGVTAFVRIPCWVDNPWLHYTCAHHATTGLAPTQFSNAPPLYYIVVGAPSLLLSGTVALYTIRATGDALNAGLIALGIYLLLRYFPRRTTLIGVLLALSPMVLFVMAVLNSSGFEIAAGFATWCGGLCVATHSKVPRALAIWTAVAGVLLILSRPTSPLDVVVIAVVFAVFVGWRELRQRSNRSLHPLWIPLVVAMIVAAVFLAIGGIPALLGIRPQHPASLLSNMATTVRLTGGYLEQSIGNFGLLDIPVPTWITVVWVACLSVLTAVAIFVSGPCRRALPVLAVAILAVTVGLEAPQINAVGNYFQGRYILPLLVGFPLLASALEWQGRYALSSRTLRRSVLALGVVLFAGQVTAFNRALQYYKGGHGHLVGVPAGWVPPAGDFGVNAMFVAGALITFALLVVMAWRTSEGLTGSWTSVASE